MRNLAPIFEKQRRTFDSGQTLPLKFRLQQLQKLKKVFQATEDRWMKALHDDLRKPRFESLAAEFLPCIKEIDLFIERLPEWIKNRPLETNFWTHNHFMAKAYLEPCPRGMTLILSPWNYPLNLSLLPLIGSIAAGNVSILKPSEWAPSTSELMEWMLQEIYPEDYVATIQGDAEISQQLLQFPFDKIFFTGSTAIGKEILQSTASYLPDVTLELGGKCPAIFDEKAAGNRTAIKRLLWGKTINAGQTCVAPDWVFVPESSVDNFFSICGDVLKEFFPDGKDMDSMARIVSIRHFDRLTQLLEGANIRIGGKTDRMTQSMGISLLHPVSNDSNLMNEEIFGPVLPVLTYQNETELLKHPALKTHPLAVYIFSENDRFFNQVKRNCLSGAVMRNEVVLHLTHHGLPFGGVRGSGVGRYHGESSFECFSFLRPVEEKKLCFDLPHRYFPYRSKISSLLRYFMS